jgi:hypothetical protein
MRLVTVEEISLQRLERKAVFLNGQQPSPPGIH